MGEPAKATEAQRAFTMKLATAVMDAVRNDEPSPLEPPPAIAVGHRALWTEERKAVAEWRERVDLAIFRLSQDLVDTRLALEIACSALQGNYTETERGDLADRLLQLDLEPENA